MYANAARIARQSRIDRTRRQQTRALGYADMTSDEIAQRWVMEMGHAIGMPATLAAVRAALPQLRGAERAGAERAERIAARLC